MISVAAGVREMPQVIAGPRPGVQLVFGGIWKRGGLQSLPERPVMLLESSYEVILSFIIYSKFPHESFSLRWWIEANFALSKQHLTQRHLGDDLKRTIVSTFWQLESR